ncbi:uncharacterized protein LOC135210505 [Macrobrachium nipponense]|uniref:uncharacterized protein LOC135210505 n=1 Tax=Macrobrachium nipponense TaxID=159736 RepID=UPI0030C84CFE
MKIFLATLAILFAVAASTNAQGMGDMQQQQQDESPKTVAREIYKSVREFLEGNDYVEFPVQKMVKMLAGSSKFLVDKLPDLNSTKISLEIYLPSCGYSNCETDAPKCSRGLVAEEAFELYKACIPGAIAAYFNGESPRAKMTECVMTQVGLTYDPFDNKGNFKAMVGMTLDRNPDLTAQAITAVKTAVTGQGCKIPEDDSCIFEMMKLHECLMNTCVSAMYSSNASLV